MSTALTSRFNNRPAGAPVTADGMSPVGREHETEPLPGLPEMLPDGEYILWQGGPRRESIARRVLKLRWVAIYFGALIGWLVLAALEDGKEPGAVMFGAGVLAIMAATALGLMELYAWGVARTTVYTVTNRRVAMRFGIAMPVILNLPHSRIASVDLAEHRDGTGTLALTTTTPSLSWPILWPHARPRHLLRAKPAFRCIPDAQAAASALAGALRDAHGSALVTATEDADVPAQGAIPVRMPATA